jgi:hypothetical protein
MIKAIAIFILIREERISQNGCHVVSLDRVHNRFINCSNEEKCIRAITSIFEFSLLRWISFPFAVIGYF